MKKIALSIITIFILSGCKSAGFIKSTNVPPDWVTGEPKVEGMICAVGMSEPTFYEEDGKRYAAENARKELARTLSVEINTIMVDMRSEKASSLNEGTVIQVSSWATSAVVENSKIMDYWFDAEGRVSQKKNITYALCCMPRKLDQTGLEEDLKRYQPPGGLSHEEIGRTAAEIINGLQETK